MKLSVGSGGIWSSLLLTPEFNKQRKREWQIISGVALWVTLIGSWWLFFLK